jgi:hypothetical protein
MVIDASKSLIKDLKSLFAFHHNIGVLFFHTHDFLALMENVKIFTALLLEIIHKQLWALGSD